MGQVPGVRSWYSCRSSIKELSTGQARRERQDPGYCVGMEGKAVKEPKYLWS